jgi:hypothetical protein
LFCASATASVAAVFDFSYTNGLDTFGSGQFFTGDASSPFTITNVTGTETYQGVSGTITGISLYAGADNQLFFPASPNLVDFAGISFTASVPVSGTTPLGTDDFGIGFTGSAYGITQLSSNPSGACCGVTPITFEVAAVPGPIVGAGLPGLVMALGGLIALRRRRMIAA